MSALNLLLFASLAVTLWVFLDAIREWVAL